MFRSYSVGAFLRIQCNTYIRLINTYKIMYLHYMLTGNLTWLWVIILFNKCFEKMFLFKSFYANHSFGQTSMAMGRVLGMLKHHQQNCLRINRMKNCLKHICFTFLSSTFFPITCKMKISLTPPKTFLAQRNCLKETKRVL